MFEKRFFILSLAMLKSVIFFKVPRIAKKRFFLQSLAKREKRFFIQSPRNGEKSVFFFKVQQATENDNVSYPRGCRERWCSKSEIFNFCTGELLASAGNVPNRR